MNTTTENKHTHKTNLPISGMYENWFLEYASYVILDRAVPSLEDGLKPVQRRLFHALKQMDDGRFHKVANVIGQTMQYHPHGDASIYEALVNLGQKELMVEMQGNWGDFRTGDKAAAARYIEARLSKFALEIAFNKDVTSWQLSYDGRKKEPINLPVKFPLLLAQGVEGIAVGLSTKILPHNFQELIKASIAVLKGQETNVLPDFPTGGLADFSQYNGGAKGSRVKVRAKIELVNKKLLAIKELPHGVTTSNLIDSIVKANDKGKIKIKKVVDNTAKDVEILIELPASISPDVTIDALYAFTNCEVSIAPNCCVIFDEKPVFLSVNKLLKLSTEHTVQLLKKELEVALAALQEKLHFASLEQIFIEKRIYRKIEKCETFEEVIETIAKALKRLTKDFLRPITREDVIRLTEIKIKRISKYDTFKAEDLIKNLQEEIANIQQKLANLNDYAITYFRNLLKKYGKGRDRQTEIQSFNTIKIAQVAIANTKLYVNRKDGFIGTSLKKDEFVRDCSDIDNVIVFKKDGKFLVTKVADKTFVGKNIIHIDVWHKGDERKIYHAVYHDPPSGKTYVKRFAVKAITYNREYDVTRGHKGSKLLYFSVHANSEAETIKVTLTPGAKAKNKTFEYNFADLAIKGRGVKGNELTKYPVRKIIQKSVGSSTLGGRKIWFDDTVGRLNRNEHGKFLGEFDTGDTILVIYNDGSYELTDFELTNRYEVKNILQIEKFDEQTVLSIIYYHGDRKAYYLKRFQIETSTLAQKFTYISDSKGSKLKFATTEKEPTIKYEYQLIRNGRKMKSTLALAKFVDVQGWKTLGQKMDVYKITSIEG